MLRNINPRDGVWVCKVSTVPGTYTFNTSASNTSGILASSPVSVNVLTANSIPNQYCSFVWVSADSPTSPATDVSVTENVPAGFKVDSIAVISSTGIETVYYGVTSKTVTASYFEAFFVKFFNSTVPTPPPASRGCTPGYWKVQQHWDAWPTAYLTTQSIATYFPAASTYGYGSLTLVQGLALKGGSGNSGAAQILLRAGIAGLLNTVKFGSNYPMTTTALRTNVNNALSSGVRDNMITLAATIDGYNNAGCGLN